MPDSPTKREIPVPPGVPRILDGVVVFGDEVIVIRPDHPTLKVAAVRKLPDSIMDHPDLDILAAMDGATTEPRNSRAGTRQSDKMSPWVSRAV
ncbi:MAG TPA: hypothetical protein VMM79_04590 [Longimicrobiales bacterium]|nr:hypothetical protein [Longimicrobiales bacterium]